MKVKKKKCKLSIGILPEDTFACKLEQPGFKLPDTFRVNSISWAAATHSKFQILCKISDICGHVIHFLCNTNFIGINAFMCLARWFVLICFSLCFVL